MDVYLIRHAHAGNRTGSSHDRYRPLSDKGLRRSHELVDLLGHQTIGAVLSSPATRCVQTVQPLADAAGVDLIEVEEFWEDSLATEARARIEHHLVDGLVVCSHGNIIPELLELLQREGCKLDGSGCQKGSVWHLRHDGKRFVAGRYLSKKSTSLGAV